MWRLLNFRRLRSSRNFPAKKQGKFHQLASGSHAGRTVEGVVVCSSTADFVDQPKPVLLLGLSARLRGRTVRRVLGRVLRRVLRREPAMVSTGPRATTTQTHIWCKILIASVVSAAKQRGWERKGPPEISSQKTGRFRVRICYGSYGKDRAPFWPFFRRMTLGQYPAAPCSPGPFVLLQTVALLSPTVKKVLSQSSQRWRQQSSLSPFWCFGRFCSIKGFSERFSEGVLTRGWI